MAAGILNISDSTDVRESCTLQAMLWEAHSALMQKRATMRRRAATQTRRISICNQ